MYNSKGGKKSTEEISAAENVAEIFIFIIRLPARSLQFFRYNDYTHTRREGGFGGGWE